jgi:hypothetical protein
MNEIDQDLLRTRRDFFRKCSLGIGNMALAHLLMQDGYAADVILTDPLAPRPPHFAPKAKAVIMLFMEGGPSQNPPCNNGAGSRCLSRSRKTCNLRLSNQPLPC